MPESTQSVVEHPIRAFSEGLDPVMEDFTDESVLVTNDDTYRGLDQIRGFFKTMIENLPEGFEDAVVMRRQEAQGELAFLLWDAKPWYPFCADTLVVRNGKILYHTFTTQAP